MDKNAPFIKGLALNKGFYTDVVKPLFASGFNTQYLGFELPFFGYMQMKNGCIVELYLEHSINDDEIKKIDLRKYRYDIIIDM